MFWREIRWPIISMAAFTAMMCLTFYLRHVPIQILLSGLLFGGTLLLLLTAWAYYRFRQRHSERIQQLVPEINLKAESAAEADMLYLLAKEKDYYEKNWQISSSLMRI